MEVKFQLAKNNEQTVSVDNHFLHSTYNPTTEAERFVENLSFTFTPKYIILIEPALSNCVSFLRTKFPDCKIGVIRFCNNFIPYNTQFDFYVDYLNNKENFQNYLFQTFGETKLFNTQFINWKNSELVFKIDFEYMNKCIKACLQQAKTLLVTRQYFEKKWLLNSVNFCKYAKNFVLKSQKINKPIFIFSSGPSAKKVISVIKQNRSKLFLICLSSAISVLKYYDITPDLYMTTDGGYWANQHLKKMERNIPLAIPTEAFCSKKILQNQIILPLQYEDSLITPFITLCNVHFETAKRNGTVAGTALEYAFLQNDFPIFMTGIDLCSCKGFQHTQPNEIESNNCISDYKLRSIELRSFQSELNSGSLDIYKSWFENFNLNEKKVFRIIEKKDKKNTLGQIQDITSSDFEKEISLYKDKKVNYFSVQKEEINISALLLYIEKRKNSENWQEQLFPLDLVSLSNKPTNKELQEKITERSKNIFNKIRKILDEY